MGRQRLSHRFFPFVACPSFPGRYYEGLQEELYTYDKVLYEMVVDRGAQEEEEQRQREEEEREREKREAARARQQYGNMRAVHRAASRAGAQPGSRAGLGAGVREGAVPASLEAGRTKAGVGEAAATGAGTGSSSSRLPAGGKLATVGVWERGSETDVAQVTGNPWAERTPKTAPSQHSSSPSASQNPSTSKSRPSPFFHRRKQSTGLLARPWAGQKRNSDSIGTEGEEGLEGGMKSEGKDLGVSAEGGGRSRRQGRGRGRSEPRVLLSGKRPLSPRKPRRVMRRR